MSRPPLRVVLVDDDDVEGGEIADLLRNGDDLEVERLDRLPTPEDGGTDVLFLLSADRLEEVITSTVARLRNRLGGDRYARRILVRDGARVCFVDVHDIDWIEAAGNYVRLHVNGAVHVLRSGIGDIEDKLDPTRFTRVHRSTIVNLDRVREIRSEEGERYLIVLTDGTTLTLSRSYRDLLRRDTI